MTISDVAVTLAGERMMIKNTGGRERPSPDEIARLAYHFYIEWDQHGKGHRS